jgi:hypothetical protein
MSQENITYSTMPKYDVYVFGAPGKGFTCYLCKFGDMMEKAYLAESAEEMELHLKAHANVGDVLPHDIFDRMAQDAQVMYPDVKRSSGAESE